MTDFVSIEYTNRFFNQFSSFSFDFNNVNASRILNLMMISLNENFVTALNKLLSFAFKMSKKTIQFKFKSIVKTYRKTILIV